MLCLVGIELWLRLVGVGLLPMLDNDLGAYGQTEAFLLDQLRVPPAVIFAGSSTLREAVVPYPLEDRLGLPRGAVHNMCMNGARPSDVLMLYRRHLRDLRGARVIVYNVEEWPFNAAYPASPDVRFIYRADLRARLRFPERKHVPDLLLGHVWKTWDLRGHLRQPMISLLSGRAPWFRPVVRDTDGRVQLGYEAFEGPVKDAGVAETYFASYVLAHHEVEALASLADLVAAQGTQLLLVRLPVRRSYLRAVEAHHAGEDRLWLEALQRRLPGAPIYDLRAPERSGLDGHRHFRDYGHLTAAGSATFTSQLATWLGPYLAPASEPGDAGP